MMCNTAVILTVIIYAKENLNGYGGVYIVRKYIFFPIVMPAVLIMTFLMLSMDVPANVNVDSAHGAMKYEVVCADSEQEACEMLEDMGYTPIQQNVAASDDRVADKVVMVGFKEVTENEADGELSGVGSIFGKSQLVMICGTGIVIGIIIGMISMKIKSVVGEKEDEE